MHALLWSECVRVFIRKQLDWRGMDTLFVVLQQCY